MKRFQKFTALSLTALMSLSLLAGCGGNADTPAGDSGDAPSGDAFPSEPITIIVPYAAGGSSDVMARVFEGIAVDHLGVNIVVENITGAGGTIGITDYLSNYENDGYTLVFPSSAPLVAQPLMSQLAYDSVNDFALVAGVSSNSQVLVVPGNSDINTLDDLIAKYQGTTGEMVYGFPAVASNPYLAQELLFQELGLTGNGVPLGGSADVVTAVLGGHVDVAACSEQEALELYLSGEIKILGSFSAEPLTIEGLEDIGTFTEMGYDVTFANWRALLAHKDIPAEELSVLQEKFQSLLADPTFTDFLVSIGDTSLADMTQADYEAKVTAELEENTALFQTLKIGQFE